jgi:hypothetical protein
MPIHRRPAPCGVEHLDVEVHLQIGDAKADLVAWRERVLNHEQEARDVKHE